MTTNSSNYETSIRNIISAMYVKDNVPFMDAVVLQLAKTLKADHVFIGKLQEDKFSVKTLSHCMDNKIVDGFEYMLKNSPCEVVYDGKVAVYPKNVTHLFPLDQDLVDLKVEGYAGIPLFNSKNKTFGAIIALYRKPIENPDFASSIMTLFANQVANEIEKQQYIEQIENLNKTLKSNIKKINEEIKRNKEKDKQILAQSRMAQMGELISLIAHQWRQPLGAISSAILGLKLNLQIKRVDFSDMEQKDKYIESTNAKYDDISGYIQFLSETIDDFRSFFNPNKDKEIVALTTPITRALQIVEGSMKNKGIDINLDFATNDNVEMFQNEIMQVILTILKNSEDNFIEKNIQNKQIDIKTFKEEKIAVENSSLRIQYIISIKDNGGGISKDILPNIFDQYFSTKDEKKGTGLGLYMSKIIVEEHNDGKIEVKNLNDGVEFRIILN